MAYLTFDEYKELKYSELKEDDFEKLLPKASDIMDVQTRNFYYFNELDNDLQFRREKFKKAMAAQIEFMFLADAQSSYEAKSPVSWSIGRTSVSESSRTQGQGQNETSIICEDSLMLLSGTGLLYRGGVL